MAETNDAKCAHDKPATHSEALMKMYTDMANGEDCDKALEEFREWSDKKAQENQGRAMLY